MAQQLSYAVASETEVFMTDVCFHCDMTEIMCCTSVLTAYNPKHLISLPLRNSYSSVNGRGKRQFN